MTPRPNPNHLAIVDERTEQAKRQVRIAAVAVDRSELLRLYGVLELPAWCPNAHSWEPALRAIRARTTEQERRDAWRVFFSLTLPERTDGRHAATTLTLVTR
jgi:hypothetical protein